MTAPQNQNQNDASHGLPASDEAERMVLSCLLQWPLEMLPLAASVRPQWFYFEKNRVMFDELLKMDAERSPIEVTSVRQRLVDAKLHDRMGGDFALLEIFDLATGPDHFQFYRGILVEKYLLRQVWLTGTDFVARVNEWETEDPRELVGQMESRVFEVLQEGQKAHAGASGEDGVVPMKSALMDWLDHIELASRNKGRITGLTTGITDLDRALYGLDDQEGEIIVLAGRPAMGKTALGCTLIQHLGEQQAPGIVFSIEMSTRQILNRIVLGGAGINTSKALTGMFSAGEMADLPHLVDRLSPSPIWFDDRSELTTADLRTAVQIAKRQHGIRWIMVDHLHLVKGVQDQSMKDERIRLVEVMQTLQFLKKEFGIVVFLMVQMNRDSDRSTGKVPVLADLSGSAAIEQYADHILFIHRPVVYMPWKWMKEEKQEAWADEIAGYRRANPDFWSSGAEYPAETYGAEHEDYEQHAMLFLKKNRRGPTPDIWTRYQPELTRFSGRTGKLYSNNPDQRQVGM